MHTLSENTFWLCRNSLLLETAVCIYKCLSRVCDCIIQTLDNEVQLEETSHLARPLWPGQEGRALPGTAGAALHWALLRSKQGSAGGSWAAGCTAAKASASSLYASLRSCSSLNSALSCGLNIFGCFFSVTTLNLYVSVRAWKAFGVHMAMGFCLSLLYKEPGLHAPTLLCKANQHLEVGRRLRDSLWTHFLSKPKC